MNPLAAIIPSIVLGSTNGLPKVMIYKGYDKMGDLTVIKMPQDYIDRTCRRLGTKVDDLGRGLPAGSIKACYDYGQGILWTSNENSIEHELCHRSNPPDWDGKQYVYKNNCDNVHTEKWRW